MIQPNLFIVGAAKCGTSSLYSYLAQHPEVFMPTIKEPRYFAKDLDLKHRWVDSEEEYLNLFKMAGNAKVLGDATVFYLPSATAAAEIKAFNPNAKIIIMLRNPVDMMYSWHGQLVHLGQEPQLNFTDALTFDATDTDRLSKAPCTIAIDYRTMAAFAEQVQRYFDVFGRSQVHIILFDSLISNPAGIYKQVTSFLNISSMDDIDFSAVNTATSKSYRNLRIRQFLQTHPSIRDCLGFLPSNWRARAGDILSTLSRSKIQRPPKLDSEIREELLDEFRTQILCLSNLIGVNLDHWLHHCNDVRHTEQG